MFTFDIFKNCFCVCFFRKYRMSYVYFKNKTKTKLYLKTLNTRQKRNEEKSWLTLTIILIGWLNII